MKNKKGFTLIELLVVVLIIGILSAIVLPKYQRVVRKTQMVEALTLTRNAADAQQNYFLVNGNYATTWDKLDISFPSASTSSAYGSSNYTVVVNKNTELAIRSDASNDDTWILGLRRENAGSTSQDRMFIAINMSAPAVGYCCFYSSREDEEGACSSIANNNTLAINLYGRKCYKIQ